MSALFCTALAGHALATPVALQSATATFSQSSSADFSVGHAIDGIINDNLGWAIQGSVGNQTAAFQTVQNVGFNGGSIFTFSLIQDGQWYVPDTLGRFRISITTDDRSQFADGLANGGDVTANWTVLHPTIYTSANGTTLSALSDGSILASGYLPATDTYTIVAPTTLTGITGVRLEAITDPSLPYNGPGRSSDGGNFILSEFQVSIAPVPEPAGCSIIMGGLVLLLASRKNLPLRDEI